MNENFAITNIMFNEEMANQLPPLKKPPKRLDKIAVMVMIWCGTISVFCLVHENWIGLAANLFIVLANAVGALFRLHTVNQIIRDYNYLVAMRKVLSTPLIAEDKEKGLRMYNFMALLQKKDIPEYRNGRR